MSVIVPAAQTGHPYRHDAGRGARRRRNRAAAVHAFNNQFWARLEPTDRLAAGHDLQLRHLAIRRLASPGWAAGLVLLGLVLIANISPVRCCRGACGPKGVVM